MKIAFYGSSLLSAYWNGAATYYRGLLRELAGRGHDIVFYEPDAFDRQKHRDIDPPDWARSWSMTPPKTPRLCHQRSRLRGRGGQGQRRRRVRRRADHGLMVAAAAPGDQGVLGRRRAGHPGRDRAPAGASAAPRAGRLDFVLTYGGGPPVIDAYQALGARVCRPIYNALDPTTHHPVAPDPRFARDLNFLANRLPDRERRVEQFFLDAAARLPGAPLPAGRLGLGRQGDAGNVEQMGHVGTAEHNAFNRSPLAVLNVARDSWPRSASRPPPASSRPPARRVA
jgi:spore maturation protein CgeB